VTMRRPNSTQLVVMQASIQVVDPGAPGEDMGVTASRRSFLVGAWLLWEHTLAKEDAKATPTAYWSIIGAWPQFARRETEREARLERLRTVKSETDARGHSEGDAASGSVPEGDQLRPGGNRMLCLPDTVSDPRKRSGE